MRFSTREAGPTKIFEYACKPILNEHKAIKQLVLANQCWNAAAKAKRIRQDRCWEMLAEVSEDVRTLREENTGLLAQVKVVGDQIQAKKVETQSRKNDPELSEQFKALKQTQNALYTRLNAAEKKAWKHETVKEYQKQFSEDKKDLRTKFKSLHLNSYTKDDQLILVGRTQKNLGYRHFNGTGKLVLDRTGVPSVEDTFSGQAPKMEMELIQTKDNGTKYYLVKLRVHSPAKISDHQVSTFQIAVHRDIPITGEIRSVCLIRRFQGPRLKWFIQFTVEDLLGFPTRKGTGDVAIDFGWRQTKDGLKVMTYCDSEGQFGRVMLPKTIFAAQQKIQDIQAIRDRAFNNVTTLLAKYKDKGSESFQKTIKYCHCWKRPHKLLRLIQNWEHFDNDTLLYETLGDWAKQERHLYDYQEGIRGRVIRARKHFYWNVAAKLASTYDTLFMDTINLKETRKKSDIGTDDEVNTGVRRQASLASCGILKKCLAESGLNIVESECKNTSRKCQACGTVAGKSSNAVLTCPHCDVTIDRDLRACLNVLQQELGESVYISFEKEDMVMKLRTKSRCKQELELV